MNMILRIFKPAFILCAILFWSGALSAQQRAPRETALAFLREQPSLFHLSDADVSAVRVTDEYVSKNSGVTHVWLQQEYAGIPVYNALLGLHVLPNGEVKHLAHRFVADLTSKVNTTQASLSADRALEMAISALDIPDAQLPRLLQKTNAQNLVFDKGNVSKNNITVNAVYTLLQDQTLRLSWNMTIDQINTADVWSIRIDAQTGEILEKVNLTVYCKAGHAHTPGTSCEDQEAVAPSASAAVSAAGTYRVFALPVESPAHGGRSLLTDPHSPTASPYGWHDTNGAEGPEYTYTRGNNVWAYSDEGSVNTGSADRSAQGGASLNFDFSFDPDGEPNENKNAAITNLFYINNMMHDFTHQYGFDEAAGNFQFNNYGNGGNGNDPVQAEALDGGGTDNANFATPADGQPGRMQMYKWSRSGGNLVTINSPSQIAGTYYGQAAGDWGAQITEVPVTGQVVLANSDGGNPTLGCDPIVNNLTDKIAMVDRGVCTFGFKALSAQNAGAKACIICNFENTTVGMAAGDYGGQVTIPVVMMSKGDCDLVKQFLAQGVNMTLVQPTVSGPDFLDGDFDNGIIAHEYGHGISNRLTGGPSQAGCLANAEQMGEGWSDWFTLVTSVKPGDVAAKRRGVGTYVAREPNDGVGIRRYPYSTDMSINPLTFSRVAENTEVHALGEIWTAVTWDLYWAMVDKYGFDPNWHNTDSGNGRAIQLVMDGMKYQPCSPGFVDGRDAIILADMINYNGADTCLISQVFARRGLGTKASQGTSTDAGDGVENFEAIEVCVKELKIQKTASATTINPGDQVQFTIRVTNHKDEALTGVTVADELPAGLNFGSASNGGTFSNGQVVWPLGQVASGQVLQLTYTAQADNVGSIRLYRDQMEDENDWYVSSNEGTSNFFLQSGLKKTGNYAWKCNNLAEETDMQLNKAELLSVSGAKPTLRFWNRYQTQAGADAGFLEFQPDGQTIWSRVNKSATFRNGYPGLVSYSTFAIPFLEGYSGTSQGWVQSYIDISQFNNQNINLRFRFGSDANTSGDGWYIDDLELIDLLNYDGEVCVTSNEGDQVCTRIPQAGIIVNPSTTSDVSAVAEHPAGLKVQPNPARELVYISADQHTAGRARLSVMSIDGRAVYQRSFSQLSAGEAVVVDVSAFSAGAYLVRFEDAQGVSVQKLMVQ